MGCDATNVLPHVNSCCIKDPTAPSSQCPALMITLQVCNVLKPVALIQPQIGDMRFQEKKKSLVQRSWSNSVLGFYYYHPFGFDWFGFYMSKILSIVAKRIVWRPKKESPTLQRLKFSIGIEYKTTIIQCISFYTEPKKSLIQGQSPSWQLDESLKRTMHHGKLGIKPFSCLLACVVVATSCLATRIINHRGKVVNGWIAPFKTDPVGQDLNSNRGKLTLLLICQSGFSALPPNPRQKERIRRQRPLLVLCGVFFFFNTLSSPQFLRTRSQPLTATHCSHRVPTSNTQLQIKLRNRE